MTNVTNFYRDFDTVITQSHDMEDGHIRILLSTRTADFAGSNTLSGLQVSTDEYNLSFLTTPKALTIQDTSKFVKHFVIDNTDIVGYDFVGHMLTLHLRRGAGTKYDLPDAFTFNFDDISKSTPQLLDVERVERLHRIVPHDIHFRTAQL